MQKNTQQVLFYKLFFNKFVSNLLLSETFYVYERGGGGRTTEPLRKGINFYFIEGKNGQKEPFTKKLTF